VTSYSRVTAAALIAEMLSYKIGQDDLQVAILILDSSLIC